MSRNKRKDKQELQRRIRQRLKAAGVDLDTILEDSAPSEAVVAKQEWAARRLALKKEIETKLPSFALMCKDAERAGTPNVFIHQNAFAAMYSDDEYTLLGKAMKYAGFFGVTINFGGDPTYVPDDAGGPETEDKDHRPPPIKPGISPEPEQETNE
jgi:hypothetical protein